MNTARSVLVAGLCGALFACSSGSSSSHATFNLLATGPGGSGLATGSVENLRFLSALSQDITLPAGITVSGQVTDGMANPMNNVEVSFHEAVLEPSVADDQTNATGDYSLTMPAGNWTVVLDSGDVTLGTLTITGSAVTSPGPILMDFQFPAPVTVSGTVSEFGGPGIAAAEVEFTGVQTGAQVTAVANATGVYTTMLVPDTYVAVVTPMGASALTHVKERFPSVVVAGASTRDFALAAGVTINGSILDNLGNPLLDDVDVEVHLPQGSNFFAPADVIADPADGTFSIGPVPPGSATFEFEPSDDTGFPRIQITRTVVGPLAQNESFSLVAGFVLMGTIFQDDGLTPEANVEIEAIPQNGSLAPDDDNTDGTGIYEISLFPGTYDLHVTPTTANLQLPEIRTIVVAANMTLDVTLTLGALVQGEVTQPGGVIPEPDVLVEIPGVIGASDVTDGAGLYSFLAPVGTHAVSLLAEDGIFEHFALENAPDVVVTLPGPVTHDIEFALATTGNTVVTGTVYETDGVTPVVGSEVTAYDVDGEAIGISISGAGGAYVLVIL